MSNYDLLGVLYDTAGKLVAVRYSIYDTKPNGKDWIDAIEMRFEGAVASAYADRDFDTIRLELGELTIRENCYVKIATSLKPWETVVGTSPVWIWLLTNQQGYEDGLRLEFSSIQENRRGNVITLVVIASAILVYSSREHSFTEGGLLSDEMA